MLSVFGILTITVLFTGIAWSRFREEDVKVMQIDTYHQRRWYVYGQLENETDITAEKIVTRAKPLPGVIEQGNEDKKIRFYVTNGPAVDKYNTTDLTYSIHILVTNTLKPEELDFVLRYTDTDGTQKAINATAVRITQDDPLYKSIGDGYIYKFIVEKEVELVNPAPAVDTPVTMEETGEGTEGIPGESTGENDGEIAGDDENTGNTVIVTEEFKAVLGHGELKYHTYDLQIVGQPDAGLLEIEITEIIANAN